MSDKIAIDRKQDIGPKKGVRAQAGGEKKEARIQRCWIMKFSKKKRNKKKKKKRKRMK